MKYDKKTMELSKKLGALQFQKLVFLLERVKYWVVDKFFPNTIDDYSKRLDKRMSKELKKCKNDEERIEIVNKYRFAKLKYKKEINNKENRNYHVDMNNPLEFIKYLEKNKKIHVNGLKSNVIVSVIAIIVSILLNNPFPVFLNCLLVYEAISAIINFECINLQNYNLCRFHDERMQRVLKKQEEKKRNNFEKNMGEGKKVIGKAFSNTDDIPTVDEVIREITTKEEVQELLNYAKKELNKKKKNNNKEEVILDNERKLRR